MTPTRGFKDCPAGCVREKGHEGFHTTVPAIADCACYQKQRPA